MPVTSQLTANPFVKTADDFAGCMANKKPQMWASDRLRWDCRHGFSFIARDDGGNDYEIGDEEVDFIVTITPPHLSKRAVTCSVC